MPKDKIIYRHPIGGGLHQLRKEALSPNRENSIDEGEVEDAATEAPEDDQRGLMRQIIDDLEAYFDSQENTKFKEKRDAIRTAIDSTHLDSVLSAKNTAILMEVGPMIRFLKRQANKEEHSSKADDIRILIAKLEEYITEDEQLYDPEGPIYAVMC